MARKSVTAFSRTTRACAAQFKVIMGHILSRSRSGIGPFCFRFWVFPRLGPPTGLAWQAGFWSFDNREVWFFMQILVRDNNVDQALRALKKKLQREGVYREMKLRRHFEKPSEKRAREKAAAVRRARKLERKRVERDGGK